MGYSPGSPSPFPSAEDDQVRRIRDLERAFRELSASIPRGLRGQLTRVVSDADSSTGFALAAGWTTKATVTLTVPERVTLATVTAIGGSAAADRTTGGLTNAQARILIDGVPSVTFEAAKDAGASVVNNILSPSSGRSFAVTEGDNITVDLQLNPLNAAAFTATPSNYASLTVIGTFI